MQTQCPRIAGGGDKHVHLAEMGGPHSDLVLSDQLALVITRSQEPPAFSKWRHCGAGMDPAASGRGHGEQRHWPTRSAFLEQEPRELSCFCLSWTEDGDTIEGQGPSKALLWPI